MLVAKINSKTEKSTFRSCHVAYIDILVIRLLILRIFLYHNIYIFRIYNMFRRARARTSNDDQHNQPELLSSDNQTSSSVNINISSSSNNILNSNLSGSLQGDAETTDDENILNNRQTRSTGASTNSSGRVLFAAIPNNSFNPSPPTNRGRFNFN